METGKGRNKKKGEIIYKLELHSEFQNDLQQAYDYYEEKQIDLGEQFLTAIEIALGILLQQPLSFQKIYSNKRKINLTKFPYGIIYFVKENTVFVIIAFHLHRNPSFWKKRKF